LKIFLILLLVVGIFLIPSSFADAFGLSCAQPNLVESFEESDVVFVGTVVSKEYLDSSDERKLVAESLFSVKEPLKGFTENQVTVLSDEKFWGINFTLGSEYLVFADYFGEDIQSQLCGPTNLVEFSNIDLVRDISENSILAPLKQTSSGIIPENVVCKGGLKLIFKVTNNSPACVKQPTAQKLLERGWTGLGNP